MAGEGFQEFAWPDARRGPWRVRVDLGRVNGVIECTGFAVDRWPAAEPAAINSTVFRSFPVGALIEEALRRHKKGLTKLAGLPAQGDLQRRASKQLELLEARRKAIGGRPIQYGPEHFARVAKVYVEAPSKPTLAVAQHFKVSQSAAAKWVARARKLGLLAPTTRGKRGGTTG